MPKYNVTFGAYVRVYGSIYIEAEKDDATTQAAVDAYNEADITWENHDWENVIQPAIVTIRTEPEDGSFGDDVAEGIDFAATLEDAREYASAELLAAAKDALESLRRLTDAPDAYRVTCIQQLEAAIAKATTKGIINV